MFTEFFGTARQGMNPHDSLCGFFYEDYIMNKGNEPESKSGGMNAHLPASPNNEPTASRKCDESFSSKNKGELSQSDAKKSGNKCVASNQSGV